MEPFDAELRVILYATRYALEKGRVSGINIVMIFTDFQEALKRLKSQEIGPGLEISNDLYAYYQKLKRLGIEVNFH